jgi:hypothetical protein
MDVNLLHGVEGVSRLVASSFVAGLWQGVVLAAGVGIYLRLAPRTTAAMRFSIWTAVFALLAVLPLAHAYMPRSAGAMPGHGALLKVDVRWSFAIAALWLMASLLRGLKLAMSAARLRGIWKRAVLVEVDDATLLAAGFRGVELCTSADVDRPSVIGFFSPRILLPEELFAELTTSELRQIVLHELGHLRRGDDWMNLLQKLSLVLVPLNPVLVWIEQRLCLERELACDDDVLRLTKTPKAYATCLTNLAEHRLGRRAAALSLGAWERRSELAKRVHSILRGGEGMSRTQARVLMSIAALGLLGGSAELARCPQFVSFSRAASPIAAVTASLPGTTSDAAKYQAVAFHAPAHVVGRLSNAPRETLLKASMPMERAVRSRAHVVPKHRRADAAPMLLRTQESRTERSQIRQIQRWVVMSWEAEDQPRMVLTVTQDRGFPSNSYAAVPTPDGWLVIQL